MSYVVDHADARASVAEAGAAVTFTHRAPGTYTASTGTMSGASTSTVSGSALRVQGDPARYKDLGLVETEAPTLLFVPDTYGEVPPLESTVSWGGTTFTVRDVLPLAPDGTAILMRVVVAR